MIKKIKIISENLELLGKFANIYFSWHFVDMTLLNNIPSSQTRHNSKFCDQIKLTPCRLLKRCIQYHHGSAFLQALNERKPFIMHCHAGALELATPLFANNKLIGVLYAGTFRTPHGKTTYQKAQAEYIKLPVISEEKLLQLGDFLTQMMQQIAGTTDYQEKESPLLPVIKAQDERLYQAASYMRHHCRKKVMVKDVAAVVGISQSRLLHLFNREMPFPFKEWLQRLRVSEALRLIEGTDLPFTAVADLCGFADHSRMSLMVRRYMGTTPSNLRKQYQHVLGGEK